MNAYENKAGSFNDIPTTSSQSNQQQQQPQILVAPNITPMATQIYTIPTIPVVLRPGNNASDKIFGKEPQHCRCHNCQATIYSQVQYKTGAGTWVAFSTICCVGLVFVLCLFGCQFIPFCTKEFKDAYHYCPNCHFLLGIHKIMS